MHANVVSFHFRPGFTSDLRVTAATDTRSIKYVTFGIPMSLRLCCENDGPVVVAKVRFTSFVFFVFIRELVRQEMH